MLLLVAAAAPVPVLAQRTTDPVAAARTMKDAGERVTRVAAELRRTFTQDLRSTTTILRTVGFPAAEMAAAVAVEFGAVSADVFYAMRDAGFERTTILDAFAEHGMRVRLDCIEPRGTPVPCGPFGGNTQQPAMGQLTWSPHSQGWTDSTLTIQGTNIPPVDVRIGATTLTLLESTASTVRARLPSAPVTGPLTLRRQSDGVVGQLVESYVVQAPPLDWPLFQQVAMAAAIDDARHWLSGARIAPERCSVHGATAIGTPGALSSTTGFQGRVRTALLQAGAPAGVADGWDAGFRSAWTDWAGGTTIPVLPWYPALALWPDSVAPPISNVPTPLVTLVSNHAGAMMPGPLAARILNTMGVPDTAPAGSAVETFATVMAGRFAVFLASAQVTGVTGSGAVPSYAPPTVVAGPVVGGTCSGNAVLPGWANF